MVPSERSSKLFLKIAPGEARLPVSS
ncbi:hypothetical protein J1605_009077 [Eschrichtius robustus]|uniref:Uncharacterized protein n=1 Tax=Eschrichtius robustus TaxID=9764 RepID=A0AB34GX44_ESCRO|nr:hypothetical protein J1605_009077 [Eschrichtius robustus]